MRVIDMYVIMKEDGEDLIEALEVGAIFEDKEKALDTLDSYDDEYVVKKVQVVVE